jgi:hypothetical protein
MDRQASLPLEARVLSCNGWWHVHRVHCVHCECLVQSMPKCSMQLWQLRRLQWPQVAPAAAHAYQMSWQSVSAVRPHAVSSTVRLTCLLLSCPVRCNASQEARERVASAGRADHGGQRWMAAVGCRGMACCLARIAGASKLYMHIACHLVQLGALCSHCWPRARAPVI